MSHQPQRVDPCISGQMVLDGQIEHFPIWYAQIKTTDMQK